MSDQDDSGMDLEVFVETTITQVMKGVANAIKAADTIHETARVNPTIDGVLHGDQTDISFDVALTVREEKSGKAGGQIKIWAASAGGEKGRATSNEAVSRVQFAVTVALPSTPGRRSAKKPMPTRQRSGF